MTRLRTNDLEGLGIRLRGHDRYLRRVTGLDLGELARRATGIDRTPQDLSFCVVPISSGQGIITGFSETVRDILMHLGFRAKMAPFPDRKGLSYARDLGNAVVMWADDARFVAEVPGGRVIDNTEATALGYVTGLGLMAGGLSGHPVLLLGCGRLGRSAAGWLCARGARVTAFDPVAGRARRLAAETGAALAESLEGGLATHDLVLIAANAAGILRSRHVRSTTRIAAPGMPCGVTPVARRRLSGKLLHDPLQVGVATMAFMAVARGAERGA